MDFQELTGITVTLDGPQIIHQPVDQTLGDGPAGLLRRHLRLELVAPDRHRSGTVRGEHGPLVNDFPNAIRRKLSTGAFRQPGEIRDHGGD